jgi:iron complex transport system permease protein
VNTTRLIGLLTALSLAAIVASLLLGPTHIPLARTLPALFGSGTASDIAIIQSIRLPRAIAAFLVGAMLGISGAALQGLLRNPLAEPGVLGVSATSALFATVTIYYGLASLSSFILPLAAIAGAILATLFLAIAALRISSVVVLILIGVGISSLAGALMSLLLNLSPTPFTLSDMVNWTMGSVANRSLDDLLLTAPFMLAGVLLLGLARRPISALSLGEEVASSVGVNLSTARLWVVLGCGLCTGAAVSIAGAVGFVGIVAPHLIRRHVNYDPGRTLVPAALLAGLILVVADTFVRLIPTTQELKLGVVAALLGAPVFIYIATQRMRGEFK